MTAAYFSVTTLRLSFCVEVSSPPGPEVAVKDGELLNLLRVGHRLLVVPGDARLDVRLPSGILLRIGHGLGGLGHLGECRRERREEATVRVRILLLAEGDEAGVVLALVADHHHVGDAGRSSLRVSSTGTGAMFSPPAVMMSSLMRPVMEEAGDGVNLADVAE